MMKRMGKKIKGKTGLSSYPRHFIAEPKHSLLGRRMSPRFRVDEYSFSPTGLFPVASVGAAGPWETGMENVGQE
jgi:hypothetical protein